MFSCVCEVSRQEEVSGLEACSHFWLTFSNLGVCSSFSSRVLDKGTLAHSWKVKPEGKSPQSLVIIHIFFVDFESVLLLLTG